jgi:hypothetical protein
MLRDAKELVTLFSILPMPALLMMGQTKRIGSALSISSASSGQLLTGFANWRHEIWRRERAVATLPINNPQGILQTLDPFLEKQTRVVLFGRAATVVGSFLTASPDPAESRAIPLSGKSRIRHSAFQGIFLCAS